MVAVVDVFGVELGRHGFRLNAEEVALLLHLFHQPPPVLARVEAHELADFVLVAVFRMVALVHVSGGVEAGVSLLAALGAAVYRPALGLDQGEHGAVEREAPVQVVEHLELGAVAGNGVDEGKRQSRDVLAVQVELLPREPEVLHRQRVPVRPSRPPAEREGVRPAVRAQLHVLANAHYPPDAVRVAPEATGGRIAVDLAGSAGGHAHGAAVDAHLVVEEDYENILLDGEAFLDGENFPFLNQLGGEGGLIERGGDRPVPGVGRITSGRNLGRDVDALVHGGGWKVGAVGRDRYEPFRVIRASAPESRDGHDNGNKRKAAGPLDDSRPH